MARIATARKNSYIFIAPEEGLCAFCKERPATKIEYTPAQNVSEMVWDKPRYAHPCCNPCWCKLYYRNKSQATNGLSGFVRGTLSVEDKFKIISKLKLKASQNAP